MAENLEPLIPIIPRVMASSIQESIPKEIQTPWFLKNTNQHELDMKKVLTAFQEFYMENVEHWLVRFTLESLSCLR
jgi:hypothetical protein